MPQRPAQHLGIAPGIPVVGPLEAYLSPTNPTGQRWHQHQGNNERGQEGKGYRQGEGAEHLSYQTTHDYKWYEYSHCSDGG